MADWTNSSGCTIRPYYNGGMGSPRIMYYQESTAISTAVIKVGDVVSNNTVVTTGGQRIVRAPSSGGNGSNLLEVAVTSILGVALEGSTSDGGVTGLIDDSTATPTGLTQRTRQIGVAVADGLTEFIGYFKSGGAGTTPRAQSSLVGLGRPIIFDSTLQRFFVASTNSTAAGNAVLITGFPSDVLGDSGGVPVIFKFLSSNINPSVRVGGPTL